MNETGINVGIKCRNGGRKERLPGREGRKGNSKPGADSNTQHANSEGKYITEIKLEPKRK